MHRMETNDIELGVIVPAYNQGKFLKETLFSLLDQSYSNLRIVVINDGSFDNSQEVLKSFEDEARIAIITNANNLGESESVNLGWRAIQSRYVAVVSGDDPQNLEWAQGMMDFIKKNPGAVGYYPNLQIIDDSDVVIKVVNLKNWSSREAKERLLCIASAGTVFNRNLLPSDFLPRVSGVTYPSDLIQILNIANHGDLKRVDGVFGVWRESAIGMTATLSIVTKVHDLHESISNWILENTNTNSELNINRVKANLYAQMWKLYRKEFSLIESASRMKKYVKLSYFFMPRHQFNIARAIWEYYFF